ncbi:MAG: hypothetical protein NW201_09840 [Gemmatimonadales bacterium]|nr:hypothetical protein [Gemmatimonadales bacterium]
MARRSASRAERAPKAAAAPPPAFDAFAVAAPGLAPLVAAELAALGLAPGAVEEGGVAFSCDVASLARANLHLAIASRVVVRVAAFRARHFDELVAGAATVPWGRWLAAGTRVHVSVTSHKSRLYHQDAVAERVVGALAAAVAGVQHVAKPAQADALEEDVSRLPGVQRVLVRLVRDECTLSVDASGALLHRRGWRQAVGKAPLRETLAAALVAASGWDAATPLLDPCCGSGTVVIEAARRARRMAPGRDRAFAMERWPLLPSGVMDVARVTARAAERPAAGVPLVGSDRDAGAIEAARANAERAGVAADIAWHVAPLSRLAWPEAAGHLVSNPPYGVRVGDRVRLRDLYARFGDVVRAHDGWHATVLSAAAELAAATRLPWRQAFEGENGGLPVVALTTAPRPPAATAPDTTATPPSPRSRARG